MMTTPTRAAMNFGSQYSMKTKPIAAPVRRSCQGVTARNKQDGRHRCSSARNRQKRSLRAKRE
jgi:hypothetical protein